jgi:putative hydrolase of the HAD superfamily
VALRGVKALLLDALGTLVELPPPAPALREELQRRFGVAVTLEQAERAIAAEIAYYRSRFDEATDDSKLRALRRDCAQVLRAALPASEVLAQAPVDAIVETLLGALRFRPYDDSAPAIGAARKRGLRVVVASNWDVGLGEVLARIGLAPLLDGVVTSASVGARKPAAAVFEAALRIAGVPPGEALHVGDSPVEDVAGARAAGLSAVLIARDGRAGVPGDVSTVASLSELSALI